MVESTTEFQKQSNAMYHNKVQIRKSCPRPVIKFRSDAYNTIYDVLIQRGYKQTTREKDWNIYWASVYAFRPDRIAIDFDSLRDGQRVNHFVQHRQLTGKDHLILNIKRKIKQLQQEGRFDEAEKFSNMYPKSFVLPKEFDEFCEEFKKDQGLYILKPVGGAQGKGMVLVKDFESVDWKTLCSAPVSEHRAGTYIAQKYIANPYLIGGKKFDLRIYVLVTSYQPLTVYLYKSAFGRFSCAKYSTTDIKEPSIHFTNVAIQKTHKKYKERGSKWELRDLKLFMLTQYDNDAVEKCFSEIQAVILRTLLCVQDRIVHNDHCFQLYGFDVLIDDQLKPWLMEVNASPSLVASNYDDYKRKMSLLDDVLNVIDLEKKLTGNEKHIGGFDLICKGEPKLDGQVSRLGAYNDRKKNLAKLYCMSWAKGKQNDVIDNA